MDKINCLWLLLKEKRKEKFGLIPLGKVCTPFSPSYGLNGILLFFYKYGFGIILPAKFTSNQK